MFWESSTHSQRRKTKGRRKRHTMLRARTSRTARGGRMRAALTLAGLIAIPIAVIVLLLYGLRGLVHLSFSGNNLFALQEIDIRSDGRLTPELIREYGNLPDSGNLFSLNLCDIQDRLEQVPRVLDVTLSRRLPGTLVVRITERVPLAQISLPGQSFLLAVDREGHVLGPGSTAPHLPVINGLRQPGLAPGGIIVEKSARNALHLLDICDRTPLGQQLKIRRIFVRDPDRMELVLSGGMRAWMPRKEMERKLRDLTSILWTIEDLRMAPDRSKVIIDMTTEERFPVRGLVQRNPA